MNISRSKNHDSLVCTYQSLEASALNQALVENGVTNSAQRRQIIAAFLFDQGILLDQCWFKEKGEKWYLGVYFSTQPSDNPDLGTVLLPDEGTSFHEYAHGTADWAIEHESNMDAIETGNE